jgi:dUTP pyrophosphatase
LELLIPIKVDPEASDLPIPQYMTPGASGMDLLASCSLTIPPGEWRLIPCGFYISIPPGYEGQIRPRSGLALKYGVTVLNAPGTIDSDYRGMVQVILVNFGTTPFLVERGSRIAQMVICPVQKAILKRVSELDETSRSEGGFGHTG